MLTRKLNKKDKIILKMYVNYILKKKYFKTFKKNILYKLYSKNKLVFTNKFVLETILTKKYMHIPHMKKMFTIYSIH